MTPTEQAAADNDLWRQAFIRQLEGFNERADVLEAQLKANTESTARVESSMKEVVETFKTFEYGFKALNTVAKFIAPITTIIAAVVATIAYFKGGGSVPR